MRLPFTSAKPHEDYLRSALFGIQDGLVSTTGVVLGISAGVDDRRVVILAGLVAVSVEASSMAAGQYSSEKAVHQLDTSGRHTDSLVVGALLMFASYFLAGLIPIAPVLLTAQAVARPLSLALALGALLLVGLVKGRLVDVPPVRSGIELALIGAAATLVGVTAGLLLRVE
jgi:VIT1/CCC1 family predicted Fe2+/Mn2+ transporter